jgi:EAL domain-containing protein (putative c-di-GMP-specific phosphodiesterase class I)
MARSLNLKVVAEGVETEAELAFLSGQQCDQIQGYWFSPPLSAETFQELLSAGKRLPFFSN